MEWLEDYSLKADCTACALVLFVTKHGISLSATFMPCRFPLQFDFMLDQRRNVDEKKSGACEEARKSKAQAKNEETIFHVYCSAAYRRLSLGNGKRQKTFFSYNFLMDIECSDGDGRNMLQT